MLLLLMCGCKKKETFTVTFDANGGTGTMEAQTFTEGEAQALKHNAFFSYDGYTFRGWNTAQDGSGASYIDGQTLTATADLTLYAQWALCNLINGHAWVDLGLRSGTLWATCNVGANKSDEYGDYFAWGETIPKDTYSWSTYKYCNGSYNTLTKYCNNCEFGNDGFTDALTTLETSDDAATANWGACWRMPTIEEMNELYNGCTHEWTTQNGVSGEKFTGPNGNSIFLPAAGSRCEGNLCFEGSSGQYCSSSFYTGYPSNAWNLNSGLGKYHDSRCMGLSVRPVLIENN